jgi:membrane protein implicated in regulation of membrane protease activity
MPVRPMDPSDIAYWHWLVLGIGLVILEVFVPGTFFLWMGVAAVVVGGLLYLMPTLLWESQLLIFAVLAATSIVISRYWLQRHPPVTDQPALNRRGYRYIGRVFVLQTGIENGVGRIRVDDTVWKVHGPDAATGCRVRVVGVEGIVLKVECVGDDGAGDSESRQLAP